jgi:hypothetical protein
MCKEGIPIIAVESGTIEKIGWTELSGWRIGILRQYKKINWSI